MQLDLTLAKINVNKLFNVIIYGNRKATTTAVGTAGRQANRSVPPVKIKESIK
jgi:hypothetical protein